MDGRLEKLIDTQQIPILPMGLSKNRIPMVPENSLIYFIIIMFPIGHSDPFGYTPFSDTK